MMLKSRDSDAVTVLFVDDDRLHRLAREAFLCPEKA